MAVGFVPMNVHVLDHRPNRDETPDLCVVADFGDNYLRRLTIFRNKNTFTAEAEVAFDRCDAPMWKTDHNFHAPKKAKGNTLEESGLLANCHQEIKEMVKQGYALKAQAVKEQATPARRRRSP